MIRELGKAGWTPFLIWGGNIVVAFLVVPRVGSYGDGVLIIGCNILTVLALVLAFHRMSRSEG